METCPEIERAISQATGKAFEIANSTALSGGSISQSQKLKSRDGIEFFVNKMSIPSTPILTLNRPH